MGSLDGRISVMPQAYLPKTSSGLSTKALLFILGGLIVVALIVVIAVLLVSQSREAAQLAAQQQVQQPAQTQTSQPTQPVQESTQTTEQPSSPIQQVDTTQEPQNQIVLPDIFASVALPAVDTDQDGLTDLEEQLFATSPAVPDTDQDGFLDGSELLNLYDPASPRALLEISPQIKIARNDSRGFQFYIPVSWTASKQTPDGRLFTVLPDSGDQQFSFSTYDNPDRLSAVQWYQANNPGADLNQFVNFSNEAGWVGIQSRDSRLIIATFGESGAGARAFIFVMHYDTGASNVLEYASVWQMMANSVTVADTSTVTP